MSILVSTDIRFFIVGFVAAEMALLGYTLFQRCLMHLARRKTHIQHTTTLKLVVTVESSLAVLTIVYGIPTLVFLLGAALIGVIAGFGSSQMMDSLVTKLFTIVARPFMMKDESR
jgi:hypothetical protein